MREWCDLVSKEQPPADIDEDQSSNAYAREVKALHDHVNTGIVAFAHQLVKFDNAHPKMASEESTMIHDMIVHKVTEDHALREIKHTPQKTYKKMKEAFMQKMPDFQMGGGLKDIQKDGWGTHFLEMPDFQIVQAAHVSSGAPINIPNTVTAAPTGTKHDGSAQADDDGWSDSLYCRGAGRSTLSCRRATVAPTDAPTDAPTSAPTVAPTDAPTDALTDAPTGAPTDAPTDAPTLMIFDNFETDAPTDAPTVAPTDAATDALTGAPTDAPTSAPSVDTHVCGRTLTRMRPPAHLPCHVPVCVRTQRSWLCV
jgi:hypothetical protein